MIMWDDAGLEKTEELSSLAAQVWSVRNYYERCFFRDRFSVLTNQRAGGDALWVDAWRPVHRRSRVSLFSTTAKPCSI